MHCPVCPNPTIPPDQTACANCGTDITPIRRLQELPARLYNEALALLHKGENDRAVAKLSAAAELDAQSEPIRALLAKVAAAPEPRRDSRVVALAAIIILALVALGALVMSLKSPSGAGGSQPAERLPRRAESPPLHLPVQANIIPTVAPAVPLASLESRLSKRDDIRTHRDHNTLRVTFNDGLFPSGSDAPTPQGRAKLASIARELSSVHVNVEGFTDPNPPPPERWSDNWALAFSRAHIAVEVMRAAGGENVTWTSSSSGDINAPHPEKENNRTVVLHISERRTP